MNKALLTTIAVAVLASCAQERDSLTLSSVDVALRLPDGAEIDTIHYSLRGCSRDCDPEGEVAVRDSDELSFQIGSLPATSGYALALTATTRDGVPCHGEATFAIDAAGTTLVSTLLTCGDEGSDNGNVRVSATIEPATQCPDVSSISALPRETTIGDDILIEGFGSGPGDTLQWSASTGAFVDCNAPSTTFRCTETGSSILTFRLSREGCADSIAKLQVRCTAAAASRDAR